MRIKFFWTGLILSLFISCWKNEKESMIPSHIPPALYSLDGDVNKLEWERWGRLLFYDKGLSRDSSISCGSCHAQVHGFADHGTSLSTGIDGKKGTRNSPAIFNVAWNTSFMWDGGINHIEVMPIAPLTNHVEMDLSMSDVVSRVNANAHYQDYLFLSKNGESFEASEILKALAAFMSRIVSFESKYDAVMTGGDEFTSIENQGYILFRKYCNSCHTEPLFQSAEFRSNRERLEVADPGRFLITGDSQDYGKFKVPSLRNLSFTYPYMHHGAERSLNEVMSNYLKLGEVIFSDDTDLQGLYEMTPSESEKIIEFLKTLDDYHVLSNPNYSEPR